MIGTLEVVIIAAAGSLGFLFTSIFTVYLGLRARDRHLTKTQDVRQAGDIQREGMRSVNVESSQLPQSKSNLRRSVHLPYGVVSERWEAIPSRESLHAEQRSRQDHQHDEAEPISSPKRRRSLRTSLSAHSLTIPKTRRQKKIEKAIPLRALPHSPLSAITEKSGTNATDASPSLGIAELPAEITPKSTPERDLYAQNHQMPPSVQWPLGPTKFSTRNTRETPLPFPLTRSTTIIRTNSSQQSSKPPRASFAPRSLSVSSALSSAPEDPLPPLPLIIPNQWATGRKSRLRLSATSVDTIGSSLLGEGHASPSQANSESTRRSLPSPTNVFVSRGRQGYHGNQGPESVELPATGSPTAKAATKHRGGLPRQDLLRAGRVSYTWSEPESASTDRDSLIPRFAGSSVAAAASGDRISIVTSRSISRSSVASSSLPAAFARTATGCKKGTVASRHSMYEQRSNDGKSSTDLAVLGDVSRSQTSSVFVLAASRPMSTVSDSHYHWDRNSTQSEVSSMANSSPGSPRRGHSQQSRKSNLDKRTDTSMTSKVAQVAEGKDDRTSIVPNQNMEIPGLHLYTGEVKQDSTFHRHGAKCPVLQKRPILKPTSAVRSAGTEVCKNRSEVVGNRNLDVFGNSRYDPSAPNVFTESSGSRHRWSLSPVPRDQAGLRATPPRLKAIQRPYDLDSPILPTPTLSSATIFAKTRSIGCRTSPIQGPRSLPASGRPYRRESQSPTTSRRIAKRDDLRRSVITSKRATPDVKANICLSRLFQDIDNEMDSSLLRESNSEEDEGYPCPPTFSIVDLDKKSKRGTPRRSSPAASDRSQDQGLASRSPSPLRNLAPLGSRLSKSRSNKIPGPPSIASTGSTSIWEDASIREDTPEPAFPLPPSSNHQVQDRSQPITPPSPSIDPEAIENFDVLVRTDPQKKYNNEGKDKERQQPRQQRQRQRSQRDRERESKLTSPQGKGLGLTGISHLQQQQQHIPDHSKSNDSSSNNKARGTPGSLYDRDGFLKDGK